MSADRTLAQLHLLAVLPALEDLVKLSPPATEIARGWKHPLRLRLRGGAQATLLPSANGLLRVSTDPAEQRGLTLNFLTARQLNRTFLSQPALPPIPSGPLWHLTAIKRFTSLSKHLDGALQPSPSALADPKFLDLHLSLLFKVLIGALPVLAASDETVRHTLKSTPPGLAQIRMDGLGLRGWARWDGREMTAGAGESPATPDVQISFRDAASASAALQSQLDSTAAVGLGQIEIHGLVPLADGLSVAMDRVETYLKPAA